MEKKINVIESNSKKTEKRVSKTWEAIQKFKGTLIVNDPSLFL